LREKKGDESPLLTTKEFKILSSETTKELRAFSFESSKIIERGKRWGGSLSPAVRKLKILSS
jgi:hypothetical protein